MIFTDNYVIYTPGKHNKDACFVSAENIALCHFVKSI